MAMARQHVMIVIAVLAEAEVVADMFWGSRGWTRRAHSFTVRALLPAVRAMT